MHNKITLVIGGCRSGKSSHALYLANRIAENQKQTECNDKNLSCRRKIFMATSVPTDQEMDARVVKHQKERGDDWITAEVPIEIPAKIRELSTEQTLPFADQMISTNNKVDMCDKSKTEADVILVDCLTLWVSNLMFDNFDDDGVFKMTQELQDALEHSSLPIFLVSNEVGMGVVPENSLARRFRDMAGMVNQKIAQTADQVIYMVAGIPMIIKTQNLRKKF